MIDEYLLLKLMNEHCEKEQGYGYVHAVSDVLSIMYVKEIDHPKNDRMRLDAALEHPVWMQIAAENPSREVDVTMKYSDLMCIYRRMAYEDAR